MATLTILGYALLWNAHLVLLPFVFGIIAYRVYQAQFITLQILGYVALLPVFWVGATAVGDAMGVEHVTETKFLAALAVTFVEAAGGMLLALALFGRFVADAGDFLETTVDLVEAN